MNTEKSKRGFATMAPEALKVLAAKGGRTAHAQGNAHRFTTEEARKGGAKTGAAMARDVSHMAEIGRRGGFARQRAREARRATGGSEDPSPAKT
jgi:general stress protein YciG